jgi:hypothetical protein
VDWPATIAQKSRTGSIGERCDLGGEVSFLKNAAGRLLNLGNGASVFTEHGREVRTNQ